MFTQPDSAFQLAKIQYEFAEKVKNKKFMAAALNTQGVACHIQGDYYKAINYYNKGLKIAENAGDRKLEASSLNNIGIIYKEKGNGEKALFYFKKSFKIKKEIKDNIGVANTLGNIGGIYAANGEDSKALDYYYRGLEIQEQIGNKQVISTFLNNIGSIFANQGKYDRALDYFEKALALKEEIHDKRGQSSSLNKIGNLNFKKGNIEQSFYYNKRAYDIANEIGVLSEEMEAAKALYIYYKETRNYRKALEMHEIYNLAQDSLGSESNQKEILRQEYRYEYEKQHLSDSLAFVKEQDFKELEHQVQLKNEQNQRYILYVGIAFLLLLGGIILTGYQRKKRDNQLITAQNSELEQQKRIVDEKNQEITDSIQYAKRIQNAILPPTKVVKEYLKESFIFYKPKDIVAGDFYWLEQRDEKVLFAAADCTGHGVPGAMVSVVCNNALNRSVREHGLTDPGEILNKSREIVIQEFEKSDEDVQDGMDIALCSLEFKALSTDRQVQNLKSEINSSINKGEHSTSNPKSETTALLRYAGAHNPLWIIRGGELIETKADKQPIGKFDNPLPYATHTFELQKGDTIYIFSDGYADQFGGEKGKKFKARAFRGLLLSIQGKNMEEQKIIISDTFETWKGNLEQIDDVCIIGVRI